MGDRASKEPTLSDTLARRCTGDDAVGPNWQVAGKWDAREGIGPYRCRWFYSWSELSPGRIAGFFAGYEGGGAFVEERFTARFAASELLEFTWNGRDHVQRVDRSLDPPDEAIVRCQDEHFDEFIRWHDRDEWDRGFLCLAPGKDQALARVGTSLLLDPGDGVAFQRIVAMTRCTGILVRF